MLKLFLIVLGGGIGSLFRYLLSTKTYQWLGQGFPYGTLVVNMVGGFLIGFLFVILTERFQGYGDQLRSLIIIGFLGGFTTFSSFSMETLMLVENGYMGRAFLNVVLSVVLCLMLTWIGILLGREI